MNKYILYLLICLIVSCIKNENKKSDKTENTIFWNQASVINRKALISFLNTYSKDNTNDLILFIGQYRDTIMATLSTVKIDLNIKQMQPIGYMDINKKKVFILMPLSCIIENDSLSTLQKCFQKAIDNSVNNKFTDENLVLIKIPIYSDTIIVSKEKQKILKYFQPSIKSD